MVLLEDLVSKIKFDDQSKIGYYSYLDFDLSPKEIDDKMEEASKNMLSSPLVRKLDDHLSQSPMMELSLGVKKKSIELEDYSISAGYNAEEAQDLFAKFNIDIGEQMKESLKSEIIKRSEEKIFEKISELAIPVYNGTSRKWYHKLFGYYPAVNIHENNGRNFITRCLIAANMVAAKTRRGPANFILVPRDAGLYLQEYLENNNSEALESKEFYSDSIFQVGNVGKIPVYACKLMKSGSVIVGRKADGTGEPSVIKVYNEPEFVEVEIADDLQVTRKLSIKGAMKIDATPNAEYNYWKFNYTESKTPFWNYIKSHYFNILNRDHYIRQLITSLRSSIG